MYVLIQSDTLGDAALIAIIKDEGKARSQLALHKACKERISHLFSIIRNFDESVECEAISCTLQAFTRLIQKEANC